MPDWFVKRSGDKFHIRFGGCEYLLTAGEWADFAQAVRDIDLWIYEKIESEGYQDICKARENKGSLRKLIGLEKPFVRRI